MKYTVVAVVLMITSCLYSVDKDVESAAKILFCMRHDTGTSEKKFRCGIAGCPKVYTASASLWRHKQNKHNMYNEGKFICGACNKIYKYPRTLMHHMKTNH